jgi:hypothetical protein
MLPENNTVKKKINNKLIEVEPYHSLPCEIQGFYINDELVENFDKEDFGESIDSDDDIWFGRDSEESPYGCSNRVFKRYDKSKEDYPKEIIEKAKEKYGLTDLEYDEVCLLLEEALTVVECGWCS